MSKTVEVLKPEISVERDCCMFCRNGFDKAGMFRHGVLYPAQIRGGFVCDNCAETYNIVCECCEAGAGSIENVILSIMNS